MKLVKYAVLAMIGVFCIVPDTHAQAEMAGILNKSYDLGGERAPGSRYYYFETILKYFEKDGARSPGHEFRLWLEVKPSADGGVKYVSRKFTFARLGEDEVAIPSLEGWEYSMEPDIDDEGRVFGIEHKKFMSLMDAKARFIDLESGYMIYNAFIDFHALSDVLASNAGENADIGSLKHIGDKIIHSASNGAAPIGLGEAMKKGSEFRNGEISLEFKGLSTVDGIPCALLEYDSGDSSFIMYMESMPGMDMVAEGASHYFGDIHVELDSRWLRKATLYELVVTQVTTGGKPSQNGIIERKLLLESVTKEAFEQL
jgi:hypothetical protein